MVAQIEPPPQDAQRPAVFRGKMMGWNCPVCHQDIDDSNEATWKVAERHLKEHQAKGDIPCWLCFGKGGGRHDGYCSGCRTSFGYHPCPECRKRGGDSPGEDERKVMGEIVILPDKKEELVNGKRKT